MKTTSILLTFILIPFCLVSLFAQESNNNNRVEKKITIIQRTISADGTESTETIVKKGKAAENFDVDKYVREHQDDKTQVEVTVNETNGKNTRFNWNHNLIGWTSNCDDKGAFLGVEEDSDEDADEPGLVIDIIRGAAAEKAGLRSNDKILRLNGVKTDKWSDLSEFIASAKPGDNVKITYSRNGATAETTATLITRKDVPCNTQCAPKGFLGISPAVESDDPSVRLAVRITKGSGAEKAGLQDGDVILKLNDAQIADFEDVTDAMAYTKPGEKLLVTYERNGQTKTTEALLGEQSNMWNVNEINMVAPNVNLEELRSNLKGLQNINCTVKEKEACLGVYSNNGEAKGATIQSFTTESAARESGLVEKDLILSINGHPVNGHSELWDEIAKYKTGDKVDVAYEHDGKALQVQATLKACRDQSRVEVLEKTLDGLENNRRFYTWNWDQDDQRHMRETRIIIIRRAGEGDAAKVNVEPSAPQQVQDRSLNLTNFKAFPNPSQGQVTVEFTGEPVATVVSLFDLSGRQLFREELNAFNGEYSQQFDLTAYAKGTIVIHVQQGEKVYTEQIVVN